MAGKKVLVVTTSNELFQGLHPHPTGVWLEEFAVPYIALQKSGAQLVVASPKGGEMPVDPRSLPTPEEKIVWKAAIDAAKNTVKLSLVKSKDFDAIFIPGGHGPMFDLPDDPDLQRLVREFYEAKKWVASVCHGPAGLVNVKLSDGNHLVNGRILTSYTNSEEIAAKLDKEVPFILEQKLREDGAIFVDEGNRADHVEQDGRLITGQNPFSSARIAWFLIAALEGELPPIFRTAQEALVATEVVLEFPENTFLENIAIDAEGTIFFTSYEDGKLYRFKGGEKAEELAAVAGNLAGIVFDGEDLLVSGGRQDKTQVIYRIDKKGKVSVAVDMPGALFLNGMTYFLPGQYLVADAAKGCIYRFDPGKGNAEIWSSYPLLGRIDADNPLPAVNGVKYFDGYVYASNTHRKLILRIPVEADGMAGEGELWLTNVNIDDFAFDRKGNIYAATHIYNSIIRISQDRKVTTIAGLAQGLTGSTAVAFTVDAGPDSFLYTTTNGGMFLAPPSGLEKSKVVRLRLAERGLPLDFIDATEKI